MHRRCAVAFWGKGARAALFGNGYVEAGTRIVCDIQMGGTNPSELKMLGAPSNPDLRHVHGLHAKVYLSDGGGVVGSANASENGIGFSSPAAHTEAGVLLPAGSQPHVKAGEWFETLFASATVIDGKALLACEEAWSRRSKAAASTHAPRAPRTSAFSLLDLVRSNPERFRGVGFVLTRGSSSRAIRDIASKAILKRDGARKNPLLSRQDVEAIPEWKTGHVFSGWSRSDVSGWPEIFVCAHRGKSAIRYWFYERRHGVYVGDDGQGVVFAEPSKTLKKELGLTVGAATMAASDQKMLKRLFARKIAGGHRLFVNGDELAAQLLKLET